MEEVDKLYLKYEILPSVIKDPRIKKEIFYESYKHAKEFKDRLYEFDKKSLINLKYQKDRIMSYLIVVHHLA